MQPFGGVDSAHVLGLEVSQLEELLTYQRAKMSHVPYVEVTSSRRYYLSEVISPIWHMLRIMLFLMSVLYGVLLVSNGAHRTTGGPVVVTNTTVSVSPLAVLLDKGQTLAEQILDSDSEMMKKINEHSTLELKTVVIAETVVPYEARDLLSVYVRQQLDASDVMSESQKEAVLTMVDLAPMEAVVNKEEIGERGTLRNSVVMALIKKHAKNIHFMLIGVRAEPRLGWNWIPFSERNAWNDVLSRVLAEKIRVEAKNYLWQRNEITDHSDLTRATEL
ncbi:hypothetical protein M758_6G164300 [Ceratodon purpureus]|nr:hypothetical protein M758_6G164300 [Ceratodon purpureus]